MRFGFGRVLPLVFAVLPLLGGTGWAEDYVVDPAASQVGFQIGFTFGTVRGKFESVDGRARIEAGALQSVTATIEAASIETGNGRRDKHLRSDHFFSVEKFPAITFRSTEVKTEGGQVRLKGLLTIRGISKEVALEGEFGPGEAAGRYAFRAGSTVNRQDWGVSWNQHADGMDLLIKDEVRLVLEGELVPKT